MPISPFPFLKSTNHSDKKKVESTLAVICFMWGTGEVWKCSVVIWKDTEEVEEEKEEMAAAIGMDWAYQA